MAKEEFVDDGRTIADMDFEGIRKKSKLSLRSLQRPTEHTQLNLTRGERKAIVLGALQGILPIVFAFVFLYFLAFLMLDIFWIR
jgi:hypothetical protein